MNNVYLGKFVGTHGLKGELKLISDFDKKDRVFIKDFPLVIDNNLYYIESARPHKNYELILLKDYNDINEVEQIINKDVYIRYDDLKLSDDEYLLSELLNAKVIDNLKKELGRVTEIVKGVNNNFVKVNNKFLIPLIDIYIDKYNKKEKILYTKNAYLLNI